jgi:hypothetical protein
MARGNNAAAAMQGSGSASGPSERIPGKPEPVPVAALLTAAQLSSLADEVVQGAPYATLKVRLCSRESGLETGLQSLLVLCTVRVRQ